MELLNKVSDRFAELTRTSPGFLHFDSMGFFRLSNKKNAMLESLNTLFHLIEEKGGNILVPSYSYTYTKQQLFSLRNTLSDLGRVSDFLRAANPEKRTTDANFSYLCFGKNFSQKYFEARDWNTFGDSSLIADIFNQDGFLMSAGDKLHYSTEIHFLEKMLNVSYRFDKDFSGKIELLDGAVKDQTVKYFCRDVEFSNKYNSIVSFERLFSDMKLAGLIQDFVIDDGIEINCVRFQIVYGFIKDKLKRDPFYLMKDKTTSRPISL